MQVFSPLPKERVTIGKPFETIAMDMAGPIHTTKGHYYYLLITCLKTRAIHLELTEDQRATTIIDNIKSFMARYGTPAYILSDNATYFILMRQMFLSQYPTITWETITPRTPHEGGVYERLNRHIKESIKRTTGRSSIKPNELRSLLINIEATLNRRPLLP
eukprot:gene21970-26075_t